MVIANKDAFGPRVPKLTSSLGKIHSCHHDGISVSQIFNLSLDRITVANLDNLIWYD